MTTPITVRTDPGVQPVLTLAQALALKVGDEVMVCPTDSVSAMRCVVTSEPESDSTGVTFELTPAWAREPVFPADYLING